MRARRAAEESRDYAAPVRTITKKLVNYEASDRCVDAHFLAKKYNVSSRLILLMAADKRIPSLRIGKCVRFIEGAVARVLEGDNQ